MATQEEYDTLQPNDIIEDAQTQRKYKILSPLEALERCQIFEQEFLIEQLKNNQKLFCSLHNFSGVYVIYKEHFMESFVVLKEEEKKTEPAITFIFGKED